jgi:hypothetical protein
MLTDNEVPASLQQLAKIGEEKRGANYNNPRAKKLVHSTPKDTDGPSGSAKPMLKLPPEAPTIVASTKTSRETVGLTSFKKASEIHGEASCGID